MEDNSIETARKTMEPKNSIKITRKSMKKKKKNRKKEQRFSIGFKFLNRLKTSIGLKTSNPRIGLHVSQDDTAVNTDFCLQVANRVCMEKLSEGLNCACSPVSIHTCLSLVAAGSTGKTLDELLFYLKSATIDDLNGQSSRMVQLMSPLGNGGSVLSFAHSLWVDKHCLLKRAFQEIAFGAYGADVKNADFKRKAKATKGINSWVESRTNGLIKQIINPDFITDDTVVILTNALYFKGIWARQFDTSSTYNRKYHLLNGHTIQVPFMHESNKHPFRAFGTYKVLKLPYQNGLENRNFSMYIFLPKKKNGLKNLIKEFGSNVGFFTQDFKLEEVDLEVVAIPRFKSSYNFEASGMVMELGLLLPFMDTGDISNMVDSMKRLFVSKIVHESCVEVEEVGTVAAASTVVEICFSSSGRWRPRHHPRPSFIADHPFMFMIREDTSGMVLFTGTVLDPSHVS